MAYFKVLSTYIHIIGVDNDGFITSSTQCLQLVTLHGYNLILYT